MNETDINLIIGLFLLICLILIVINTVKAGTYSKKIYEHLKLTEEKNKSKKEGEEMVDDLMKKVS